MKLNIKITFVATIFCVISFLYTSGQVFLPDSVELSTIQVKKKKGFDKDDFIRMTKTDTSFYKAFKNLNYFGHKSVSTVNVRNKKGKMKASMQRTALHYSNQNYAWIKKLKETTKGKYYTRRGNHKYFTAEMYDKVFFQKDTFPVENLVNDAYTQKKAQSRSKEDKYYEQLKKFMFAPGTGVDGVPLIGKKLNIFDGKMTKYYNYTVEKKKFHDSIPVYVFRTKIKDGIKSEKVVIQELTSYYDRRTMQIIARTYKLKQNTAIFDFDIKMYIELDYKQDEYVPKIIRYSGNWDVPMKKPERIDFQMINTNFKIPKKNVK